MGKHRVRVLVTLKDGVLDPQGLAIKHVMDNLGKAGFDEVRQGKVFDLQIDADSPADAVARAKEAAASVLTNPILERFSCSLVDAS